MLQVNMFIMSSLNLTYTFFYHVHQKIKKRWLNSFLISPIYCEMWTSFFRLTLTQAQHKKRHSGSHFDSININFQSFSSSLIPSFNFVGRLSFRQDFMGYVLLQPLFFLGRRKYIIEFHLSSIPLQCVVFKPSKYCNHLV